MALFCSALVLVLLLHHRVPLDTFASDRALQIEVDHPSGDRVPPQKKRKSSRPTRLSTGSEVTAALLGIVVVHSDDEVDTSPLLSMRLLAQPSAAHASQARTAAQAPASLAPLASPVIVGNAVEAILPPPAREQRPAVAPSSSLRSVAQLTGSISVDMSSPTGASSPVLL